jgi:hypothetical protein
MAVDTAPKRHAALTFAQHPIAYPDGSGVDIDERAQTSMAYYAGGELAVETRLLLGVRHPRHDQRVAPTLDRCVSMETTALTDEALFEVTTSGSDSLDETAGLRFEFEIGSALDDTSWRVLDITDVLSSRTTMRVDITGSPTRDVTVTVDDGTTTEAHSFDGTEIARRFGRNQRARFAVEFLGGATVNLYSADLVAGSLESAAFELVASATTALAALDTPTSGRKVLIDSGAFDRIRFWEMRVIAIDSSANETVAATIDADSVDVSSSYTANGVTWTVDPAATVHEFGDFENIIDDVRSDGIGWKTGRSRDQLEQIAGNLTCTLNNRGRKYEIDYASSSIYPGNTLDAPVRLQATYGGRVYDLFGGYAESWHTSYMSGVQGESVTALHCYDALALLSGANTGGNIGTILTALDPVGYWPLDGSGTLTDDSTNSNDLTTATDVVKNWESVLWGNEQRHPLFNGTTSVLRDTSVAASTLQLTGDWSVVFALRTDTGGDYHICSAYGTGGAFYGVELDCAPGQAPIVRGIRNDATPTDAGNDITLTGLDYGYFSDDRPHLIVVTYDTSEDTIVVYVDGTVAATSTDAFPASVGTPVDSGTTEMRIGLEGTHGSGTTGFNGILGHVAVFDKVLSAAEALNITRANISGFVSQPPHHRCRDLLLAYGWPASQFLIEADTHDLGSAAGSAEVTLTGSNGIVENGSDNNITVEVPETAHSGDLFVVAVALPSNKYFRSPTPEDQGFTQLLFNDQGGSTDVDLHIYYRTLTEDDLDGFTFQRPTGGAHSVFTATFDGYDTATPFSNSATDDGGSSTSVQSPSITAADGDFLLSIHCNFNSGSTINTWTTPNGLVELANLNSQNKNNAQRPNMLAAGLSNVSAGATTAHTATASVAGVWVSAQVAVNAAGAAGGTVDTAALAAVTMTDKSFRQQLLDVTTAEIGEFFACADGVINCRGRNWRTDYAPTVSVTVGDAAGQVRFSEVNIDETRDQIVNQVTVTDADGNVYTVIDETSIDTRGLYSEDYDVQVTGVAAAKAWADSWLTRYKDPRKIYRVAIPAGRDFDTTFPLIGNCDMSERWRLIITPPGGGSDIDEQFHVESLSGMASRDNMIWFTVDGSETT